MLVLACSFSNTFAQSGFAPLEWTPEVFTSTQCELEASFDVSDALETVVELMENNNIASCLPKSCMEIKESSSASPSRYYTISNGIKWRFGDCLLQHG